MNLPRRQPSIEANDILARISEVELFRYYISNFSELGKAFCSELRRDQNPSAVVKMTKGGYIRYMDFADDSANGDIFTYLSHAFLMTYDEVLTKVARDFGITEGGGKTETIKKKLGEGVIKQKEYSFLQISTKKFTKADLAYWGKYLINTEDLRREDIYSVSTAFLNRKKLAIKRDELAFAYFYHDIERVKLYFPERKKGDKWISNLPLTYIEGLNNLANCNRGIVTKGKKDRIVIQKIFPNVCNSQNETRGSFSADTLLFLQSNVGELFLNFDSDLAGKKNSLKLTSENHWKHLNVPDYLLERGIKDYSDWVASTQSLDPIVEHFKSKGLL